MIKNVTLSLLDCSCYLFRITFKCFNNIIININNWFNIVYMFYVAEFLFWIKKKKCNKYLLFSEKFIHQRKNSKQIL